MDGSSSSDGPHNPFAQNNFFGESAHETEGLLKEKQRLKDKESQLAKQEAALRRREQGLSNRGGYADLKQKNWPRFFPITYHSIADDIPSSGQQVVKAGYALWFGAFEAPKCVPWITIVEERVAGYWARARLGRVGGR